MPVMASREEWGESSCTVECVANSHDLLAHAMNRCSALHKDDVVFADRLAKRQMLALSTLLKVVDEDVTANDAVIWNAFTICMRSTIAAHLKCDDEIDLRYMPMNSVPIDSTIHQEAISHAKGHNVYYGLLAEDEVEMPCMDTMSYIDIIRRAWRRLVASNVPDTAKNEVYQIGEHEIPAARMLLMDPPPCIHEASDTYSDALLEASDALAKASDASDALVKASDALATTSELSESLDQVSEALTNAYNACDVLAKASDVLNGVSDTAYCQNPVLTEPI
jgi:hypothetical protein